MDGKSSLAVVNKPEVFVCLLNVDDIYKERKIMYDSRVEKE